MQGEMRRLWCHRREWSVLVGLVVLLAAGGCANPGKVAQSTKSFPQGRGFVAKTVYADHEVRRYVVFVPKDYDPAKKYPTIVFLHGLFEGGTDGLKPLGVGIGPEIAKDPAAWPFITVFPQAKGNWKGDANDRLVMACLNETMRQYSVDRDRVILAGLSFGGLGTWQIGARHTDVFAALVPVGGFADVDSVPPLRDTPVWAFHFTGDVIVPVKNAHAMVDGLQRAGGNVKLTEFAGVGHNPWPILVDDSGAVQWMLRQRLSNNLAAAARRHSAERLATTDDVNE
jgi:predicted peptidase